MFNLFKKKIKVGHFYRVLYPLGLDNGPDDEVWSLDMILKCIEVNVFDPGPYDEYIIIMSNSKGKYRQCGQEIIISRSSIMFGYLKEIKFKS